MLGVKPWLEAVLGYADEVALGQVQHWLGWGSSHQGAPRASRSHRTPTYPPLPCPINLPCDMREGCGPVAGPQLHQP